METSEDLRRVRSLLQTKLSPRPTLTVINCVGMRGGNEKALNVVNADFPAVLAEVTTEVGAHLIHLGSAAEIVTTPQGVASTIYQQSKRRGTDGVLRFPHTTVLRIFNLHGLPHQEFAGLHAVCQSLAARRVGAPPPQLFDTVRDYVHWSHVIEVIQNAVAEGPMGLEEVGSGHSIALSEIIGFLPGADAGALLDTLIKPDLYSSAVSTAPHRAPDFSRDELLALLAREVSECASC
jgi:nucleoside-diphosphate-sugar epimerase